VSKKQFFKVTGFIGTLAAGTALVASAATGTGAWFTDSEPGTITANSGHMSIDVPVADRSMNFANLMPGDYQHQTVNYTVHQSSGESDVWLVFSEKSPAVAAFTGPKDSAYHKGGGLGRYGHFLLRGTDDAIIFQSNNLAYHPTDESGPNCWVAADGHGGSDAQATSHNDAPPYCGVPYAIKVASNLANGTPGHFTVEFGFSGRQTEQGQSLAAPVPFQVVVTQAGHGPSDPSLLNGPDDPNF
jgi:hypothetical protein